MGIRPVLIWKSTAAAPTPTSVGPCEVPSPFRPWHEEQVVWNSALPAATWVDVPVSAATWLPGAIAA